MLLSDIDTWNVGALQSIAFELSDELTTIEGVASDLEMISRLPRWDSPAADAARGKIHATTGKVLDDAAVIGAYCRWTIKPNLADKHVFVLTSPDDPVSGGPTLLGAPVPGLGDLNQPKTKTTKPGARLTVQSDTTEFSAAER